MVKKETELSRTERLMKTYAGGVKVITTEIRYFHTQEDARNYAQGLLKEGLTFLSIEKVKGGD